MRIIIAILIVAVLLVLAALLTGLIDINQIRGGKAPQISASRNGISARGGRAPGFDVETGTVKVGSKRTTVPTVSVVPANESESDRVANQVNAM